jgi:hypothetical protein
MGYSMGRSSGVTLLELFQFGSQDSDFLEGVWLLAKEEQKSTSDNKLGYC